MHEGTQACDGIEDAAILPASGTLKMHLKQIQHAGWPSIISWYLDAHVHYRQQAGWHSRPAVLLWRKLMSHLCLA